MSEIVIMKSEEKRSIAEVSRFFRDLANRIDSGRITFTQGNNERTFELPNNLELELKVEEKTGLAPKIQFEIELEWLKDNKKQQGITIA
jgi:amphi-Trp domain-containing protein